MAKRVKGILACASNRRTAGAGQGTIPLCWAELQAQLERCVQFGGPWKAENHGGAGGCPEKVRGTREGWGGQAQGGDMGRELFLGKIVTFLTLASCFCIQFLRYWMSLQFHFLFLGFLFVWCRSPILFFFFQQLSLPHVLLPFSSIGRDSARI